MGDQDNEGEIDLYGDGDGNVEGINENEILGTEEAESGETPGNGVKSEVHEDLDEDLFEEALTESSAVAKHNISNNDSNLNTSTESSRLAEKSQTKGKRFCCYVGNMTWWTTDQDLANVIAEAGILDLIDVKFYENRANGQSKGFALVVFASDTAVRMATERLPQRSLHNQQLVVLPYTKQALAQFDAATRKPGEERKMKKEGNQMMDGRRDDSSDRRGRDRENRDRDRDRDRDREDRNFMGTIRLGQGGGPPPLMPPGMSSGPPPHGIMMAPQGPPGIQMQQQGPPPSLVGPPIMMGQQGPQRLMMPQPLQMTGPPPNQRYSLPPNAPPPAVNRPPPGFPQQMGGLPPLGHQQQPPPQQRMHQMGGPPPSPLNAPPHGAHINPAVYPGVAAGHHGPPGGHHPEQGLTEAEFEEIMNRNRTVSSSAISRAVSDAAAGDYASAIETLVTAISLIRQSRVANDDRCKVLITSLQDTLHGIEAKSYNRRTKERRERSRSPRERDSRGSKRHRRSRSRSRSRERMYKSTSNSSVGSSTSYFSSRSRGNEAYSGTGGQQPFCYPPR